jgi:putative methylase
MRKHDLAIKLQNVSSHPTPKLWLEQYTVPADLAAEILFRACYEFGDIEKKTVADLGTGTGRLALGAAMLGARYTVGVDLDPDALNTALRTSRQLGLEVDWLLADINTLRGAVDTVIMNPPFGTKRPHADIEFLQVALRCARVTYSIHKSSTRRYLTTWLREHATRADRINTTKMEIPHQFPFHTKRKRHVDIDILRIEQERSL